MRRGDLVLVALPGDYGKPRPAVVVQADAVNEDAPESFLVCPLTTTLSGREPRVVVVPTPGNGLASMSEIMTDKLTAAPRGRCREVIGQLGAAERETLDRAILLVLGFT